MAAKPSIPKGTRDFGPLEVNRRHYILDIIRGCFQKYGYQPIETPSFENLDTLLGKYGEEGDRLIFKILNSGDFLSSFRKSNQSPLDESMGKLTSAISKKALRYDLTVPFARYVVQHQNEISFPFKRYQMQAVWRADRPQKGRFQEFWQCDADVVGSNSLLQEVELVQIYDEVFSALGLNTSIEINNRKVLTGLAQLIEKPDQIIDLTVGLDKLDKIGKDKVLEELLTKGFTSNELELLAPLFESYDSNRARLDMLSDLLKDNAEGTKGIEELEYVLGMIDELGLNKSSLEIELTLARGLNYYTGCILEVTANDAQMGSIGGGGRYDDLTGIFGLRDVSGIGISFGLDRIYLVLEELGLFPSHTVNNTDILFANFGSVESSYCMKLAKRLRDRGISCEVYPDTAKMKKQFSYADKKEVRFMGIIGSNEMSNSTIMLKDMKTGTQEEVSFDELVETLTKG